MRCEPLPRHLPWQSETMARTNEQVMGRANDLKSYVKQGTDLAETEIELKAKRGKNVVIKRKFQREDDKSEWFINGERQF